MKTKKLTPQKLRENRKRRIAARKQRALAEGEEFIEDIGDEELDEEVDEGLSFDEEEELEDEGIPPADLPEEDELPADDLGEGCVGAFNYSPIYQKPTHLGSDKPSGGYHYYGPLPDAGTSYGYYVDADNDVGIIAPMAGKKNVFSPVSGKPMKLQGKVGTDGVATVLAIADQMTTIAVGDETRMTSAPLQTVETPQVFDPMTGFEIEFEGEMSAEDEEEEPMLEEEGLEEEIVEDEPMEGQDEEPMLEEEGLEEEVVEEEPMLEEEEEAEAVEYEALQAIDEFADESVAEDDVHMTLFDEGTPEQPGAEPYWNIDIGGQPVARVYLKDQPKPDEIRQVFCSPDYYRGVAGAIEKVGLKPVLKQIKAHIWANKVEQTKLAKGIKAKVDAEAKTRVDALTKNLMKDLLQRIAIVCAGMDKNFYKDVGNPLKESLWSEMHKLGIANPSPMIEAAFRQGSTKYFEKVLSKAIEYMEMEPVALEQIKDAIGEMDILPPGDESVGDELPEVGDPDDASTLSERLAASSVAVAGVAGLSGNPVGEHKNQLSSELRLGGAGPRVR